MSDSSSLIFLDEIKSIPTPSKGPKKKESLYAVIKYVSKMDNNMKRRGNQLLKPISSPESEDSVKSITGEQIGGYISTPYSQQTSLLEPIFALESNSQGEHEKRNSRNWEFKCKYCDKIYMNGKYLRQHYINHAKERRELKEKNSETFLCPICKKTFKHSCDLSWHVDECKGRFLAKHEEFTGRVTRRSQGGIAETIPKVSKKVAKEAAKPYRTLTKKEIMKISSNQSKILKHQENKVENWLKSIS